MRLLFVARAAPHKGLSDLLSALRPLKAKEWSLTIVGAIADDDRPKLNSAQAEFGARLSALGARPLQDVSAIMRDHDALVIPSRYENFCNVALEGLACGLPVIGVDLGGIRDMVRDGENGVLFAPRSIPAITAAIERMIAVQPELETMREAARRTARLYSWPLITDLTHEALLSVLWARDRGNP
jgi:glycosyltransferase involved in cell wall biosynthesis